jgi:hypothetical protein
LHEATEADHVLRNRNVVCASNVQESVKPQRPFQMAMELDLGKAAEPVQGGSDAFRQERVLQI